jgi:hypothetical protein
VLRHLIFLSAAGEAPRTLAGLLAPYFVSLQPGASLFLADGGKMLALPAAESGAQFARVLADPQLQRELREWTYLWYTVRECVCA